MSDDFEPLIDREREPESRIHTDLTEPCRDRLLTVISFVKKDDLEWAFRELQKKVGTSEMSDYDQTVFSLKPTGKLMEFVQGGKTEHVLTFIEYLILRAYKQRKSRSYAVKASLPYDRHDLVDAVEEIRHILATEGILWDLEHNQNNHIQFYRVSSESMKEADDQIQALMAEPRWSDALKGYDRAFELWKKDRYDEKIPRKLYNSIEEVLRTICVDLEEWTDNRELKHSKYLDMLNENDVYHAHGATPPELNQLLEALSRMVGKISDDRHQRHIYHDRTYSTLLIHQVGAYLYFLINRYEQYENKARTNN